MTAQRLKAQSLALCIWLICPALAAAENLIVSFSSDHIAIDSNFTGAELTIFGTVELAAGEPRRSSSYDIAMIVRGPAGSVTVREKEPAGPFWFNRSQRRFEAVPSFLAILSNRPIENIAAAVPRPLFSVDAQFAAQEADADRKASAEFPPALIRLRRLEGLFSDSPDAVSFLSPGLFRATIRLPGSAPLGRYDVHAVAFADGEKIAETDTGFWVNRTGLEHVLAAAATRHGVLYGFAVIAMALSAGWIASVIFRRD